MEQLPRQAKAQDHDTSNPTILATGVDVAFDARWTAGVRMSAIGAPCRADRAMPSHIGDLFGTIHAIY